MSKLMNVAEAAEQLNVSISCVYQLVERGKLPHHRIGVGRGAIRFSDDDISGFLLGCHHGALKPIATPERPRLLKHIRRPS
jgi:excisionase family DNA binding protein